MGRDNWNVAHPITVPRSTPAPGKYRPGAFFGDNPEPVVDTAAMDLHYPDTYLRDILRSVKTIAAVGLSANPIRPSNFVGRYLAYRGYRVIGVNPGQAGKDFYGVPFVGSLEDLADEKVDMIDIFRRSEAVPPIVDEALRTLPSLSVVWMQVGVRNEEAALRAEEAGCKVIQNRCPKIEYQRLFGELRKAGFNTGIISSKLEL